MKLLILENKDMENMGILYKQFLEESQQTINEFNELKMHYDLIMAQANLLNIMKDAKYKYKDYYAEYGLEENVFSLYEARSILSFLIPYDSALKIINNGINSYKTRSEEIPSWKNEARRLAKEIDMLRSKLNG